MLVKELQEALSMLRLQTSFLHQSKEIIQRWCKTNFYDDDYNTSYPNTSMVVCLGKEASKTNAAVTDSAATNHVVEKSTKAITTRQTLRKKFKSITTTQAINVNQSSC
jgi:hypothetical protein